MNGPFIVGGLVLTAVLVLATFTARWWAAPTGVHRAPRAAEQPAQPVPLLRPTEALVEDLAYCPAEETDRLHAFLATGGRVCWTCRTFTPHGPLTSRPEVDRG